MRFSENQPVLIQTVIVLASLVYSVFMILYLKKESESDFPNEDTFRKVAFIIQIIQGVFIGMAILVTLMNMSGISYSYGSSRGNYTLLALLLLSGLFVYNLYMIFYLQKSKTDDRGFPGNKETFRKVAFIIQIISIVITGLQLLGYLSYMNASAAPSLIIPLSQMKNFDKEGLSEILLSNLQQK